jgi:hypothetical protein
MRFLPSEGLFSRLNQSLRSVAPLRGRQALKIFAYTKVLLFYGPFIAYIFAVEAGRPISGQA